MPPEQSYGSGNQYDFIINPDKPPKKPIVPVIGGHSSFTQKLIFIVGGGVALVVILWIVATLLGGGGNTAGLTKIVQEEEEIARVAAVGVDASRADIRGAAINTQLSLNSQQQDWLQFLANKGTRITEEQQMQLQNTTTDQQLESARTNNAFDKTFLEVMRSYLTDYASTLQTTFNSTSNQAEQDLLNAHYTQTQLLLEQLPES